MDGVRTIAAGITNSTTLVALSLEGNQLMQGGGARRRGGGRGGYGGYGGLGMANNATGGFKALADALPTCAALASVNLSNTCLGPQGAALLAPALQVCASLTKLNIWNNNIGVEGATTIVNAAPAQMRTVCGDMFEEGQTEADLSGKKLGPEGAILVAWDLRAGFVSSSMKSLK